MYWLIGIGLAMVIVLAAAYTLKTAIKIDRDETRCGNEKHTAIYRRIYGLDF